LPALRKELAAGDPEIRRRVEVLTQRIERTVLLTPKRVTLVVKNSPVKEVIESLAKQTGYRLQWQGNEQARITLNMENVTFWQAMERLMLEAGAVMNVDDQQGIVYLYQQEVYSPYYHHEGTFRLQAVNFNYNKYINLMNLPRNGQPDQNQQNENLYFSFQIMSEPKAPLLGTGEVRLIKAEDENGQSLIPQNNPNDYGVRYFDNGGYRNFQFQAQVQMRKPSRDSSRAKIIKGRLPVTLLSGTKPEIVIEKLAKGLKVTGASVDIDVEDVQEQNKSCFLTLSIKRQDRGAETDPNWINSIWQRLELYDAKGRKYLSQGANNFLNNTPTSLQASFQFGPPQNGDIGKPFKLVYNQWLTITHEVEFEFRDVPLP
jgi:hypothetical protein